MMVLWTWLPMPLRWVGGKFIYRKIKRIKRKAIAVQTHATTRLDLTMTGTFNRVFAENKLKALSFIAVFELCFSVWRAKKRLNIFLWIVVTTHSIEHRSEKWQKPCMPYFFLSNQLGTRRCHDVGYGCWDGFEFAHLLDTWRTQVMCDYVPTINKGDMTAFTIH